MITSSTGVPILELPNEIKWTEIRLSVMTHDSNWDFTYNMQANKMCVIVKQIMILV